MFVRASNPIWFFNNLTGQVLDDTYWAFFLTNTLPYLPEAVFQDPNGTIPWSDPIEFQPSGGLPNNLYFDPNEVYRIEIRKGPNQTDPLIWLIENFIPNGSGSSQSTNFMNCLNMVTNSQFSVVNFASPFTIKTAGTYDIAPGWQLILDGAGTSVLNQVNLPGEDKLDGNPPFALEITNTGWNSAKLIQQFNFNGALFSETLDSNGGSISMSLLVEPDTNPQVITLNYTTSEPFGKVVKSQKLPAGIFSTIAGVINIPPSNNANLSTASFTQMQIILPASGKVTLTNAQFVGQLLPVPNESMATIPPFQEETIERQVDHMFHYYAGSLISQPKGSILAGWDFGLNPWQFGTLASTNIADNSYILDQTILIQQNYVATATGNNVAVGRALNTSNYALQITPVTAHNQFAILQYIDPKTVSRYWGLTLSSMVTALYNSATPLDIRIKARLIYKAGLPNTVSQTDPIVTWLENEDPVAAAGYTLIAPKNDPAYTLEGSNEHIYAFNGFQLPVSSSDNMVLGILIYTIDNQDQTNPSNNIHIFDVNLVQNDFAMPTPCETFDEALRKCQYYYEYSYDPFTTVGAVTAAGSATAQTSVAEAGVPELNVPFKVTKRVSPVVTWYSTVTGAPNTIRSTTVNADYNVNVTSNNTGCSRTGFPQIAGLTQISDTIYAQWVADARLGK